MNSLLNLAHQILLLEGIEACKVQASKPARCKPRSVQGADFWVRLYYKTKSKRGM